MGRPRAGWNVFPGCERQADDIEGVLNEGLANELSETIVRSSKEEFNLDDTKVTISVIPNQINKFSDSSALPSTQ